MRTRLRPVLPVLLVTLALAACKPAGKPSDKPADQPAQPAPAAAIDAGPPAQADARAAVPPDAAVAADPKAGPKPLTPEEKAKITAYARALQQGRRLTAAGKHDEAIRALDEALKNAPNDPTALAQRGYARRLKSDWAAARQDLVAALAHAPSHLVRASTLFNLGKVAEGEGKKDEAESFFAQAKEVRQLLRPGAAAAPGTCPVRVERPRTAPRAFATWPALAKALRDEHGTDCNLGEALGPAATTPAAIKAALLEKEKVALLTVTCSAVVHHHVVAELPDGRPALHLDLAVRQMGRCTTGAETVELRRVPVPHVFVHEEEVSMDFMCQVGDQVMNCEKAPEGSEGAGTACNLTSLEHRHHFLDPRTFAVSLVITEFAPHRENATCTSALKVLPDAAGLTLEGRGCQGRKETF